MVVNKHKHIRMPGDVYIGRGGKWGNPFVIGKDGDRAEVIAKHRRWLWAQIKGGSIQLEALAQLHGKTLVCFCAPLPCHGHTLEKAAMWAVEQLRKNNAAAVETPAPPAEQEAPADDAEALSPKKLLAWIRRDLATADLATCELWYQTIWNPPANRPDSPEQRALEKLCLKVEERIEYLENEFPNWP